MTTISDFDFLDVGVGFVVNLRTLRQILKGLSVDGRRWWIASDPMDALASHSLTIGHGNPGCVDRLNTLYFKIPVLNDDEPLPGTERLALLLDSSVFSVEQPGFYMEDGLIKRDELADIESFFQPIRRELLRALQRE